MSGFIDKSAKCMSDIKCNTEFYHLHIEYVIFPMVTNYRNS